MKAYTLTWPVQLGWKYEMYIQELKPYAHSFVRALNTYFKCKFATLVFLGESENYNPLK